MAGNDRRTSRGGGSRKTTRGGRHVVVVESPVKARTIGGYLGREYRVIASRGHVRDLPAKAGSVKPEDGFSMVTETGKRAARTLAAVAKALAKAETLVLATDHQLGGTLPALGVALAPAGVVLERAGQHHPRHGGFDEMGVGLRDPPGRIADLPPVAGHGLAAGIGADRQPSTWAERRRRAATTR